MLKEPRGLVGDIERAVELVSGDALLARRHQVERLQPLVQRDLAALHDRALGDGEVLAAFLLGAAIHAGLLGLVGVVDRAAVRADRAIGPEQAFQESAGRVVVAEVGAEKMSIGVSFLTRI